jgi:hypothetical protein
MALTIYSEILILIDVLFRNVFGDHIIGHISRATAEIPSRPHVLTPRTAS